MKKRIISMVLCIVMLVSICPARVLAAGDDILSQGTSIPGTEESTEAQKNANTKESTETQKDTNTKESTEAQEHASTEAFIEAQDVSEGVLSEDQSSGEEVIGALDGYGNNRVYDNLTLAQVDSMLSGSGTKEDPYKIYNASDFYAINYVEYWHEFLQLEPAHYKQMADIDLTDTGYDASTGTYIGADFAGVYNGDGYQVLGAVRPLFAHIQGNYIGDENDKAAIEGKFSSYNGNYEDFFTAQIVHVTIVEPNIFQSWSYSAAALALKAVNTGIYGCKVIGGESTGIKGNRVAALVVDAYSVVIDNCKVENMTLEATSRVSGLASNVNSNLASSGAMTNSLIINCTVSGDYYTAAANMDTQWHEVYAGGLVCILEGRNSNDASGNPIGKMGPQRIINCSSEATVTVSCSQLADYRIGGIIGYINDWVDISGCTFTGEIVMSDFSGKNAYVGGVAGNIRYTVGESSIEDPKTCIRNCDVDSVVLPANDPSGKMYVGRVVGNMETYIFDTSGMREGDIALSSSTLELPENFNGPLTLATGTITLQVPQSVQITTLTCEGSVTIENKGSIESIISTTGNMTIGSNFGSIGKVESNAGNIVVTSNMGTIGDITSQKGSITVGRANVIADMDENASYGNGGTIGNLTAGSDVTIRRNTGMLGSVTAGTAVIIGQAAGNNFNDTNCYHIYQLNSGTIGAITAGTTVSIYNNTKDGKIAENQTITAGSIIKVGSAKAQKNGEASNFTYNANYGVLGDIVSVNKAATAIDIYSLGSIGDISQSNSTSTITLYVFDGTVGNISNLGAVTVKSNSGIIGNITSQNSSVTVGADSVVADIYENTPYGNAGAIGNLDAATSVTIRRNTGIIGNITADTSVTVGQNTGANFTDTTCYHTYQINSGTIGAIIAGTSVYIYNNVESGRIAENQTITSGLGMAIGTAKVKKKDDANIITHNENAGVLGNLVSNSVGSNEITVYSTGKVGDITKEAGSGFISVYSLAGTVGNVKNFAGITIGAASILNGAAIGDLMTTGEYQISVHNGSGVIGNITTAGGIAIITNSGTIGNVTSQNATIVVGIDSKVAGINDTTPYGNAGEIGNLNAGTAATVRRNTGTIGDITADTSVTLGQASGNNFTNTTCYHTYQINSGTIGAVTAGTDVGIYNNIASGKIAEGQSITAGGKITIGTAKAQKSGDAATFTYNANEAILGNVVSTSSVGDAIGIYSTGTVGDITKSAGVGTISLYATAGTVGKIVTNSTGTVTIGSAELVNGAIITEISAPKATVTGYTADEVKVTSALKNTLLFDNESVCKVNTNVTVYLEAGVTKVKNTENNEVLFSFGSDAINKIVRMTAQKTVTVEAGVTLTTIAGTTHVSVVNNGTIGNVYSTTGHVTIKSNTGNIDNITMNTGNIITITANSGLINNITHSGANALIVSANSGTIEKIAHSGTGTISVTNGAGTMDSIVHTGSGAVTISTNKKINYVKSGIGLLTLKSVIGKDTIASEAPLFGTVEVGGSLTVSGWLGGKDAAEEQAITVKLTNPDRATINISANIAAGYLKFAGDMPKQVLVVCTSAMSGAAYFNILDFADVSWPTDATFNGPAGAGTRIVNLDDTLQTSNIEVYTVNTIDTMVAKDLVYNGTSIEITSDGAVNGKLYLANAANCTLYNYGSLENVVFEGSGTLSVYNMTDTARIKDITTTQRTGSVTVIYNGGTIDNISANGAITIGESNNTDKSNKQVHVLTTAAKEAVSCGNDGIIGGLHAGTAVTMYRNTGTLGSITAGTSITIGQASGKNFTDTTCYHTYQINSGIIGAVTAGTSVSIYNNTKDGKIAENETITAGTIIVVGTAKVQKKDAADFTYNDNSGLLGDLVSNITGSGNVTIYSTGIVGDITKPAGAGTIFVYARDGSIGSIKNLAAITIGDAALLNSANIGELTTTGNYGITVYNGDGEIGDIYAKGAATILTNSGKVGNITSETSEVRIGSKNKVSSMNETTYYGNSGTLGNLKAGAHVIVYRNTNVIGNIGAGTYVLIGQNSANNFTDTTCFHTHQINSGTIGAISAGTSVSIYNNTKDGKIAENETITAGTIINVGTAKAQKKGNTSVFTYNINAGVLGDIVSDSKGADAINVYSAGTVGDITKSNGSGSVTVYAMDGTVGNITNYFEINIVTNCGKIGNVTSKAAGIVVGADNKIADFDTDIPYGNADTIGDLKADTFVTIRRNMGTIGNVNSGTNVLIGQNSAANFTDTTCYHNYQVNSGTIGSVTAGTSVSIYNNTERGKIAYNNIGKARSVENGTITAGTYIYVGTSKVQKKGDASVFTHNANAGLLGNLVSNSKNADAITVYSTGTVGDISKPNGRGMITVYAMDGTVGDITNLAAITIGSNMLFNEATIGNLTTAGNYAIVVWNGKGELGDITTAGGDGVTITTNSGTIGNITAQAGKILVGAESKVADINENIPYGNAGIVGDLESGTYVTIRRNTGIIGGVTAGTSVNIGQNSAANFTDTICYHTYQVNSGIIGAVNAGTSVTIYNNTKNGKIAENETITAGTTVTVGTAMVQKKDDAADFTYNGNAGVLGSIIGGQNNTVTIYNAGAIESITAKGRGALNLNLLDGSKNLNPIVGVGTTTITSLATKDTIEVNVSTQGNVKNESVEGCKTAKVNVISNAPKGKDVVVSGEIDTVIINGSGNVYGNSGNAENVLISNNGEAANKGEFIDNGFNKTAQLMVDKATLSMVFNPDTGLINVNFVAYPQTAVVGEVTITFSSANNKEFEVIGGLVPNADGNYSFVVPGNTLSERLCSLKVKDVGEIVIKAEGKYSVGMSGSGYEDEIDISNTATCIIPELITRVDKIFVANQEIYDELADQYGWKQETAPASYPAIAVIPYLLNSDAEISVKLDNQDVKGSYFIVLPEDTVVAEGETYPVGTLTAVMVGDYPVYESIETYTFTMADQVVMDKSAEYYKVTFLHNVIGVSDEVYYVKAGEALTVPEAEKRNGYLFAYWQSGASRYYPGGTIVPTGDLEITAVRIAPGVKTYTLDLSHEHGEIKYQDDNGLLIYIADHMVLEAGTKLTLVAENVGIYSFKEWKFSSEPTDCDIRGNTVSFSMNENMTVTAVFQVNHNYGELVARIEPTCSSTGFEAHYFCDDCDTYFTSEKVETTKEDLIIAIDKNAHNFGLPTYQWSSEKEKRMFIFKRSSDKRICTAVRACIYNAAHIETEDGVVQSTITQAKSCTEDEYTNYTATFTNPAFTAQIKENVKTADKLGHEYGKLIKKVSATCSATGFEEHYFCVACGVYFTSEKAETTKENLIIAMDENAHSYKPSHSDDNGHWIICEICGKELVKSPSSVEEVKSEIPETGDGTNLILWISLTSVSVLLITAIAIVTILAKKRRR